MIVGIKTERFISVERFSDRSGYFAIGNEVQSTLHSTKGWRGSAHRRQILGPCEKRDAHRALTQGSDITFMPIGNWKHNRAPEVAIPITEKMLMRHRERRRDIQRAANIARNAEEDRQLSKEQANGG